MHSICDGSNLSTIMCDIITSCIIIQHRMLLHSIIVLYDCCAALSANAWKLFNVTMLQQRPAPTLEMPISLMTYCLPSSLDFTRMALPKEPSPIFLTLTYLFMLPCHYGMAVRDGMGAVLRRVAECSAHDPMCDVSGCWAASRQRASHKWRHCQRSSTRPSFYWQNVCSFYGT